MQISETLKKNVGLVLLLVVIGFSVYAFNLQNKLFWDDDDWIVNNSYVHNFAHVGDIFSKDMLAGFGLNSNYYRPLLSLSFASNYIIDGVKPLGYHVVSNAFHILNGVLIFILLIYVFRRALPAFLASVLFIIHPLQTEAVTYISGRGDPMSVFFMLLSVLIFIKYNNSNARKYLFGSLTLMLLALLSRETAVLLAPLLLIVYISFLTRERFWKSIKNGLLKIWPYFALAGGYGILRLTVLNFQNTLNFYNASNVYADHISYRLYTFSHVFLEYLKLIFVPVSLHMERDFPIHTSFFQFPVWIGYLAIVTIILIGYVLYRRESLILGRLPAQTGKDSHCNSVSHFRIWFFSWSWFFVSLSMVSGIIPINAIIYEHWLYLPLIGFFALAGFYLDKFLGYLRINRFEVTRWAVVIVVTVYLGFFSFQAIKRNIIWGQPVAFYEEILRYSPGSIRITNNLGNLYSAMGRIDDSAIMYQRIIDNPENMFAQPYYNLGNIYRDRGDLVKAEELYTQAIAKDKYFPFSYQNLASIYVNRGNLAKGAEMLEIVKQLKPSDPRIYYNLGLIYNAQNNKEKAIQNLNDGLTLIQDDATIETAIRNLLSNISQTITK
jgi:tetratricopeptide (TPR) repeat protein